jgi:hypothetical protein
MPSATEDLDWNDGRLVELTAGKTARCRSLTQGELYGVLLYNTTQADVNALVTVVWSNDVPPSTVTVSGTTGDAATAYFLFVSGTDTDFISISLAPTAEATVEAFIVSVSMPSNTTGLNSGELPRDGQFHSYQKFDRYWAVPATGWSSITIENTRTQFISLQILKSTAKVIVVNLGAGLAEGQVTKFGPTAEKPGTVDIVQQTYQTYEGDIQGNSRTWVWMNGDSQQNSDSAKIALQGLSATEVFLKISGLSYLSKIVRRVVPH